MARRRRFSSNTVRTVGALLPSDVLSKAMAGRGLEGLEVDDYGFDSGDRLRDVVNDAWNESRAHWWRLQAELRELPEDDLTATALTREVWLLPLLELLGFDNVEVVPNAITVGGTDYPISHMQGAIPLHLMGARVELDARVPGIRGAARLSPHSLVQQFLNRSNDHLWAMVTNGTRLRILRDSVSLTRQAFVEFDLEAMFNGEVFPDFVLLYKVAHATRFAGDRPEDCLLERWIAAARDEGIRALDQLREGVETALTTLGTGFLRHRDNQALREAVKAGDVDAKDMYRYLLRLIYRLLFLFVAEDRDLLLIPDASPEARERYEKFYSTVRLRELASRPTGSGHADLWRGLTALMDVLGRDEGEPSLGLAGMGSFLWSSDAIGPLSDGSLDNEDLLVALRGLAYVQEDGVLRRIDFAAMGAEELGSVYESLLELHPAIDETERSFMLGGGAGSERKTTGSYYTPTELISELLDSALDPVLEEAAAKEDPEQAILDLKVVDPAAGSGHFLVAAAHRIGKKLAEVRTEEPEPPVEAYRTAVRDVVSRCLYAVDINDLAVELCKVSLWLEALEPGKPLSFLDHHILVGNSIFGATPAVIADGIPDEAFVALIGDDSKAAAELKKRNRIERAGQEGFALETGEAVDLGTEIEVLEEFDDSDLETVRAKERMLAEWKTSPAHEHALLVADTWCTAFAIEKKAGVPTLTEATFRLIRDDGVIDEELRKDVAKLSRRFAFFHWHLAFPQVFRPLDDPATHAPGWSGGFDVALGNPPWERVKLQERQWFASRLPEVAGAPNKAARDEKIKTLSVAASGSYEERVYREFRAALRRAGVYSHFMRRSNVFPLGGVGDVNVYAVFADLFRQVVNPTGRAGFVCPTGLATGATYAPFFQHLLETQTLWSFFSFENEDLLFPAITNKVKFALVTIAGGKSRTQEIAFTGYVRRARSVHDPARRYTLDRAAIVAINPNSKTAPLFRHAVDAQVMADIHVAAPILVLHEPKTNTWGIDYMTMFHMANDSGDFIGQPGPSAVAHRSAGNVLEMVDGRTLVPLYEGKMLWHYDHRYGTYAGQTQAQANKQVLPHATDPQHADPSFYALPRYWMDRELVDDRLLGRTGRAWLIAFRDVGPKERTMVPSIVPRFALGHAAPILISDVEPTLQALLLAQLSSFVVDYALRQQSSGRMTLFVVEQAPVLPPTVAENQAPWGGGTNLEFILPRVVELVHTAWDVTAFAEDCGFAGPPFVWNPGRRSTIRAELDAAMFHLFEVDQSSVEHIMDTFTVLRKHDEAEHGSFHTKELILDVYDRMATAIEIGRPYETIIDPPPADPSLRIDALAPDEAG